MNTLFIHTNNKQMLGAKLSKYSFEKQAGPNRSFEVKFIVAEELKEMQEFRGKTYNANGRFTTYTFNDLQSFTLTRFKPPELMGYQGRAMVIDPDIFALPGTDLGELFAIDLEGHNIAACQGKHEGVWASSVMVLECANLKHWKLSSMLERLATKQADYSEFLTLQKESVKRIPSIWNSMDVLTPETKVLHISQRLTQPWKTGLKIDFTPKLMPKLFGIIPREPIYKLLGRYQRYYLPHPNQKIIDFFFLLAKDALRDGAVTEAEIRQEIEKKDVRPDFFEVLATY
jgi:hypothetical protein